MELGSDGLNDLRLRLRLFQAIVGELNSLADLPEQDAISTVSCLVIAHEISKKATLLGVGKDESKDQPTTTDLEKHFLPGGTPDDNRQQITALLIKLAKLEYGLLDKQIAEIRSGKSLYGSPSPREYPDENQLEFEWSKWNYLIGRLSPLFERQPQKKPESTANG